MEIRSSKCMLRCTLGNVNSMMVWIINTHTHKHSTESYFANCKVALKHSFKHPVSYALNQWFHSGINSQQKHLQHLWTRIKTITLTFKSLFTVPAPDSKHYGLSHTLMSSISLPRPCHGGALIVSVSPCICLLVCHLERSTWFLHLSKWGEK